jgi:hypothetical protein
MDVPSKVSKPYQIFANLENEMVLDKVLAVKLRKTPCCSKHIITMAF